MTHSFRTTATALALLAGLALASQKPVSAQPAPIPRLVMPSDQAPEGVANQISRVRLGQNVITIAGAAWLQLQFDAFDLGKTGTLSIMAPDGERQDFTQTTLNSWEGLTAIFNGTTLTVVLDQGAENSVSASIGDLIIGLPAATGIESTTIAMPKELRDFLGEDMQRFVPDDFPKTLEESVGPESICGSDNRVATNHPFIGRIMPIGCTGWIINGGSIITAGHCISTSTQTLEFNVGSSQPDGTTVSPGVVDQYKVISNSIVSANTGVGNDWAIFQLQRNTQSGLTAELAQGGGFSISKTLNPANVRITGFGVDGPSPRFGNPPPRNADNQTQQSNAGALTQNSVQSANQATLRYTVDSQGGNSGGPVIAVGSTNTAIGIHTNGGCTSTGGSNAATSFRNSGLWNAIPAPPGPDTSATTGWLHLLLK